MSEKSSLLNHLDATDYLIVLMGVISVAVFIFNSNFKWWIITPTILLFVLSVINKLLDYNLKLIKEYKSLMTPLGELSTKRGSGYVTLHNVIMQYPENRKCWEEYFNLKQDVVNTQFDKLNTKLDKFIFFKYCLWNKNAISLIGDEFRELFVDTKKLYETVIEWVNEGTNSEHPYRSDCDLISNKFTDFYSALKNARNDFKEIKENFPDTLLSHLPSVAGYYGRDV